MIYFVSEMDADFCGITHTALQKVIYLQVLFALPIEAEMRKFRSTV